jgi:hypothetical protein
MIIDCHGHYTTAPKEPGDYRDQQKADLQKDPQGAEGHAEDQRRSASGERRRRAAEAAT